ncbi:META domain-containing protein [Gallaecimonas xiamenensis]|uniref:DUF306 domain-containing protein n=1 Tax=Gallaecimonas xiamenensis 3-C-1 TaxID=745411 RepID=K2J6N1_9GAMM|nr:META domain-containing protein [Gallaecimonas xiamenensis]EKE70592.1 hypothetical protein B3C1_13678 [Gallaecimonas xiamenensis 3-C-1]
MPLYKSLPLLGLASALALAGCASEPQAPQSTLDSAQPVELQGELNYLARIALPPQAYAVVEVRDNTGKLVKESRWKLNGKQVPLPFSLTLPAGSQAPYDLQGAIFVNGRPAWVSEPDTIKPMDNAVALGQVELKAAPPGAFASRLQCGSTEVRVNFTPSQMLMYLDGNRYVMAQTRAASGARYEAVDQPGTVLWNKGHDNWVTVKGQALPDCQSQGSDLLALTGKEWRVEDINGKGILDGSHVSLNFGDDGRVTGSASCNNFFGSYQFSAGKLELGGLASTQKACVPALMDQEYHFLQTLQQASHFDFTAQGALVLSSSEGGTILAR